MEHKLNFSVEFFAGVEGEILIVRIPKSEIDPRLGYDTKVFVTCSDFADWLRSLPSSGK